MDEILWCDHLFFNILQNEVLYFFFVNFDVWRSLELGLTVLSTGSKHVFGPMLEPQRIHEFQRLERSCLAYNKAVFS